MFLDRLKLSLELRIVGVFLSESIPVGQRQYGILPYGFSLYHHDVVLPVTESFLLIDVLISQVYAA